MTYVLTDDDIETGDAVTTQLEKMWGWYLVGAMLAMIFGFFVISYRHASVYAIIYLASGFFIAVGAFEIVGAIRLARQRWLHLVFGLIWIGAGIVGFVWPHITIFIVAVLIGWASSSLASSTSSTASPTITSRTGGPTSSGASSP